MWVMGDVNVFLFWVGGHLVELVIGLQDSRCLE